MKLKPKLLHTLFHSELFIHFFFCLKIFNETFKYFEQFTPRKTQIELGIYLVDFMQSQKNLERNTSQVQQFI